ncbi:MAG: RsbRD N-terminal domain-containing protein [Desulfarculaceae bacterium]|nr:RsbRD N-terminal domain-containing protein [Desulfarculaceae bacterium]MCF8074471.1 RsbRD N-terminal domain-containing protein [Desulfarculaceae bacterium]MCF8103687.1 RsbRD N-terminal domain-containing protein [Desulfarculaceae bacterium]MCF8118015.1 RsbRD N-terminal domain-containing protein [Desulfarculaceae bacterium]
MKLKTLLAKHKSAIVKQWINSIVETYPSETAKFLKSKKDQFSNPVGHTIMAETNNLFEQVMEGIDREKVTPFLDRLIRVRAIQDFTPSQALSFVFSLKYVIRRVVGSEIDTEALDQELVDLEASIDYMALVAFDVFMGCREQLYDLKVKEIHSNAYSLLRRAKILVEQPGEEPENA